MEDFCPESFLIEQSFTWTDKIAQTQKQRDVPDPK